MKLYHYTSVDSLEYILKDKTMRFNNLTSMDDPLEIVESSIDFNKLTYVSCWTNDSSESIPMWSMYTEEFSGIRLELDHDMFLKTINKSTPKINNVDKITHVAGEDVVGFTLMDLDRIGMSAPTSVPELVEIEYLTPKTLELIRQHTIVYNEEKTIKNNQVKTSKGESIYTWMFGKYKAKNWEFQKEWRFILRLYPFTLQESHDFNLLFYKAYKNKQFLKASDFIRDKLDNHTQIPKFLLLPLNPEVLDQGKIVLGPNISNDNRKRVYQLCSSYSPNIKIENSQLEVRIK